MLVQFDAKQVFGGLVAASEAPASEPVGVDAFQLARDVVLAEQEFRRAGSYLSGEAAAERGERPGLSDWAKGLGWGALAVASVTPWGTLGKLSKAARIGEDVWDVGRVVEGVSGLGEAGVRGTGPAGDVARGATPANELMLLGLAADPVGPAPAVRFEGELGPGGLPRVVDGPDWEQIAKYSEGRPVLGIPHVNPSGWLYDQYRTYQSANLNAGLFLNELWVPPAGYSAFDGADADDLLAAAVKASDMVSEPFVPNFEALIRRQFDADSLRNSAPVARLLKSDFRVAWADDPLTRPNPNAVTLFTKEQLGGDAGVNEMFGRYRNGNGLEFWNRADGILRVEDSVRIDFGRDVYRLARKTDEFVTHAESPNLDRVLYRAKYVTMPSGINGIEEVVQSPSYGLMAPVWLRQELMGVSRYTDVMAEEAAYGARVTADLLASPEAAAARGSSPDITEIFTPVSTVVAKLWDVLRLAVEPRVGYDLKHLDYDATLDDYLDFVYSGDFNYLLVRARLMDIADEISDISFDTEWQTLQRLAAEGIGDGSFGINFDLAEMTEYYNFNPFVRTISRFIKTLVDNAKVAENTPPGDSVLGFMNPDANEIKVLADSFYNNSESFYQQYVLDMLSTRPRGIMDPSQFTRRETPVLFVSDEIPTLSGNVPAIDDVSETIMRERAKFEEQITVAPFIRDFDLEVAPYQNARRLSDKILALEVDIDSIPKSIVYWQRVGNENVQSVLRSGRVERSYDAMQAAENLVRSGRAASVDDAFSLFRQQVDTAVPYIDDFIDSSSSHGGFIGYRGLNKDTVESLFGPDGQQFIMRANNSSGSEVDISSMFYDEPGFLAFSLSPQRAGGFASRGGIILRYKVSAGEPAGAVNGHLDDLFPPFPGEFEFLLNRNARVQFTRMITSRDMVNVGAARVPSNSMVRWSDSAGEYIYVDEFDRSIRPVQIPVFDVELVYDF